MLLDHRLIFLLHLFALLPLSPAARSRLVLSVARSRVVSEWKRDRVPGVPDKEIAGAAYAAFDTEQRHQLVKPFKNSHSATPRLV